MRYVLEGSVQPTGNQVRVNAQLIDAESGAHLWAEQFDTPRADLLQTQDEIVTRLARTMYLQLPGSRPRVSNARLRRIPSGGFGSPVPGGLPEKRSNLSSKLFPSV